MALLLNAGLSTLGGELCFGTSGQPLTDFGRASAVEYANEIISAEGHILVLVLVRYVDALDLPLCSSSRSLTSFGHSAAITDATHTIATSAAQIHSRHPRSQAGLRICDLQVDSSPGSARSGLFISILPSIWYRHRAGSPFVFANISLVDRSPSISSSSLVELIALTLDACYHVRPLRHRHPP